MIEFDFKIPKLANQFFFISNLSEWHFSCRKDYNKIWLEKTGALKDHEKKALTTFSTIITENGFTLNNKFRTKYLGQFFQFQSNNKTWREVRKVLHPIEYQELRKIFNLFKYRFEIAWKDIADKDKRIRILKNTLSQDNYKSLFNDLEKIFGSEKPRVKIKVVVLFTPLGYENTAAGGANVGSEQITLELPRLKLNSWQLHYSVGILAHEMAHLLFNKRGGQKMISSIINELSLPMMIKNLSKEMNVMEMINEAITESFVPIGYLGQKYSHFLLAPLLLNNLNKGLFSYKDFEKVENINYHNQLDYYLIWQLYPLSIIYGRNKKRIDKYYIREVANTIKHLFLEQSV